MATANRILAGILGGALIALSGPATAEEVPFVDGTMWDQSAPILKRTYLVGVANLMSAEYAVQQKHGPPPDSLTGGIDPLSCGELVTSCAIGRGKWALYSLP